MQAVTLLIGAIASVLVLLLSPIYGLIIYVITLAYYPSYITIKLGTLDFSVTRIVILAIYANLFVRSPLVKKFKFTYLDILVIIYFVAQLLAGLITTDLGKLLENRSGAAFDMLLPYFAVRAIVTKKEEYVLFLKACLYIIAPMAIFGFYECWTGHGLFPYLRQYAGWNISQIEWSARLGLTRARFVLTHPIMFGLYFAIMGPICAGILKSVGKYKILCWLGLALMGVGVFSSMSSGPMLATLVATAFIAFYRFRRNWRLAIVTVIVMCILTDLISNRRFYYLPGRFTFNIATAWYRGRLIDVTLFEGGMSGNWLTGYGIGTNAAENASIDWAAKIGGGPILDLVNQYILILFQFGLIGLTTFLTIIAVTIRRLIKAFKASLLESDRWLIWCLSGSLCGLLFAFVTVSLHAGQSNTLFFILIGLCSAMPLIIADPNSRLVRVATSGCRDVRRFSDES